VDQADLVAARPQVGGAGTKPGRRRRIAAEKLEAMFGIDILPDADDGVAPARAVRKRSVRRR
jgi:hypothetical protein